MNGAPRSWRKRVLATALAAALALALVAALQWRPGQGAPAAAEIVSAAAARHTPGTGKVAVRPRQEPAGALASRIELEEFERRARDAGEEPAVRDAFAAASPDVAAPGPARHGTGPARAARPAAPPLPFQYLGRYDDGKGASVVLLLGERVYIVSPGHVIEDTWRVERIDRGELELTYLPLRASQTMRTGE